MKHVFIIGCKGIPAQYGGFESFVDRLTFYKKSKDIKYHVACMNLGKEYKPESEFHEASCFYVTVPAIGPAKAVYYDIAALDYILKYIRDNKIENADVYILACRIGIVIKSYKRRLQKLKCNLYVNPDGHEWKRAKWNYFIRKYWKFSEKKMIKEADLVICDSLNIEKYIKTEYARYNPKTTYIAYGAEQIPEKSSDKSAIDSWCKEHDVTAGSYYLIVGRFVPENNYETVIREFMSSDTDKKLVLITNVEKNKFYEQLLKETDWTKDERIHFAGTVYNQELLLDIRRNACAYIHGHEVGGTNPSLLEAMAATDVNLLLQVGFNEEVGKDAALYWSKEQGNLAGLIEQVDDMEQSARQSMSQKAKERIQTQYSWEYIVELYEKIFLNT